MCRKTHICCTLSVDLIHFWKLKKRLVINSLCKSISIRFGFHFEDGEAFSIELINVYAFLFFNGLVTSEILKLLKITEMYVLHLLCLGP